MERLEFREDYMALELAAAVETAFTLAGDHRDLIARKLTSDDANKYVID